MCIRDRALVFTRTKHGADRLQKQLDRVNINSKAIHGNKTQNNRMKALEAFKNNNWLGLSIFIGSILGVSL